MFDYRPSRKGSIMIMPLAVITTLLCVLLLSVVFTTCGVKLTSGGMVIAASIIFILAFAVWACILPR